MWPASEPARNGAWGAGELCSPRTIAGGFGNPPRVPDSNAGLGADIARWETEGGAAEGAPRPRGEAWFEEHPGEITLKVRAPDLAGVFTRAGEALAGLMLGEPEPRMSETAHERFVLEAGDRAALLVAWLTELICRAEISNVVFTRFDVRVATEQRIEAEIHGVTPALFRNPVKAATYHGLAVEPQVDGGYVATVILDV